MRADGELGDNDDDDDVGMSGLRVCAIDVLPAGPAQMRMQPTAIIFAGVSSSRTRWRTACTSFEEVKLHFAEIVHNPRVILSKLAAGHGSRRC